MEIELPNDAKIYCMAITTRDYSEQGKPSSWSGAVDSICYNDGISTRFMIISGGNIEDSPEIWDNYPDGSSLKSIQSPAQAWNALTVGAFTDKINIDDPDYNYRERVAPAGGVSPYNSTSVSWNKIWPIKPEVVFEGGNMVRTNNPMIPYDSHTALQTLTTSKDFQIRQFDTINATSVASAEAANFAAKLIAKYPDLWAESLKGLIVHSSKWTDTMIRQFRATNRRGLHTLLHHCGYGVPDVDRAFNSRENGFTYISQNSLKPFTKKQSYIASNEMHFYDLPWPSELLKSLGEVEVALKITLSYFIDPSPGEIGWKDKFRYQSAGLRFDVNNPQEDVEPFKRRINKAIQDEENGQEIRLVENDSQRWLLGVNNRNVGSIHSDIIRTTGVDLSSCNKIAVFPITGWWKTRTNLKRYNDRMRYSLIVSLDTPAEHIDLYNDVRIRLATRVAIPVEIPVTI